MSIKSKVLTATAVLTLAGALSTVGTVAASAATTQCGAACIQIFSKEFGTYASPGFIESVFLGIPLPGVPTILHRASIFDPTGDFIVPLGGAVKVSEFFAEGMVSAAVNAHYGTELGVQVEYAPYGHATGLCAAVARPAYQGEGLSLQPCSTPGTTVFILDFADSPGTAAAHYFPIVNASTTDFIHPFTMTMNVDPAHSLFAAIRLEHMIGNPTNVPDNQLWGSKPGPAQ